MSNIVIDTSAVIAVILDEPEKNQLIELTRGTNLIAPASLNWEICNAFSVMFKKKRISLKEATAAIKIYKNIPIQFIDVDLVKTIEISYSSNIYAYDAYMVACSLAYKAPMLTLDVLLKQIAKKYRINVLEV